MKGFIKGVVLGGIALGVTALLLAPKAGKKLRADIKKGYRDASKKATVVCDDVCEHTEKFAENANKFTKKLRKKFDSMRKK